MSEFRRDIVTGDWVIIAPERAKRPDEFLRKPDRTPTPKETCPFENFEKTGNWPPILDLPAEGEWDTRVIPNKYPALSHAHLCAEIFKDGIYDVAQGVGHHELVITRDHVKPLAAMTPEEGLNIFSAFQSRYRVLGSDDCVEYAVAFLNYGPSTGGSVYHPHYQIFGLPIVPPDVANSLAGSERYHKEHGRCVHCDVIEFERNYEGRVVAENAYAVALAPYASRNPFEVRIYPKKHEPYFERMDGKEMRAVVMMLEVVLARIRDYLRDPDLNFFIHSSPMKQQEKYGHYHWHIEIFPKISIAAGFELSTGVLINVIDPDLAAKTLRGGSFGS
jgi:UDPglucose--hexose-1-phosphate uridylyltransferase